MSFKVKNSQLNSEALECINNLIEEDINAASAFRLSRILKYMSSIVEDKVNSEKKIFDKWVQRNESGEPLRAKDENGQELPDTIMLKDIDAFSKDMSDLLNLENEIPFDKLNFDDLQLKTAKIKDLLKIDFLFT